MANKDDEFFKDFGQVGRTAARKMLDRTEGSSGYKTTYTWTPDGFVRMQTHGGFPRTYPLKIKPIVPQEVLPGHNVFQVATRVEIPWPSAPYETTWVASHWMSKDPAISLAAETVTAKGDCEWFGASPKVVTWFGLSSMGRQAGASFYQRGDVFTRYRCLPNGGIGGRLYVQKEAVWVNGEKWFDLPDGEAPMCAAMHGDFLRVIAVVQSHFSITDAFAKGVETNTHTHLANLHNAQLLFYEGTKDSMVLMRTVTYDISPGVYGNTVLWVQSLFFSPDGTKAAGIVGDMLGQKNSEFRILEVEFSTGAILTNKPASKLVDKGYAENDEDVSLPTGLPHDNGSYLYDILNNEQNYMSASATESPVAVEYRHSDGKLVILYRKDYTIYGDMIFGDEVDEIKGEMQADEFDFVDVTQTCEDNRQAVIDAYTSVGLAPPAPYYYVNSVPNVPFPTRDNMTLGGSFPGTDRPDGVVGYEPQQIVWIGKRRYENSLLRQKTIKDRHYELRDIDDNVISTGYSCRTSVLFNRGITTSYIEYNNSINQYPFSFLVTNYSTSQSTMCTVTITDLTIGAQNYVNGANKTLIDVTEESDGHDIVACDLRRGIYVMNTPGGRIVSMSFPSSHKSGNWVNGSIPGFVPIADANVSMYLDDLEGPLFGIQYLTSYKDGNHLVFSAVDSWGGTPMIAHWSPNMGVTPITIGAPHEAPIYFRGKV